MSPMGVKIKKLIISSVLVSFLLIYQLNIGEGDGNAILVKLLMSFFALYVFVIPFIFKWPMFLPTWGEPLIAGKSFGDEILRTLLFFVGLFFYIFCYF